jgi:transmembrane sensor
MGSDTASEADWTAFEVWLDQSPAHGRAYDEVEELWLAFDDTKPAAHVTPAPRTPPRRGSSPWPWALAASLVLAVGAGLWLSSSTAPAAEIYTTAKGATREIALADGSRVRLNTASRISVRLTRGERDVGIDEGEAAFDVAKDPRRPFVIAAGDRQITVVGTEFNVLRHDGRLTVTVRRGVVAVSTTGSGARRVADLTPGLSLQHREGDAADLVAPGDPRQAFAWTQNQLVFADAPLSAVVEDLNRYFPTPIFVSPDAGRLRLTAAMQIDNEEAVLRRLGGFLPVRYVQAGGAYHLGLRQPSR